MPGPDRRRRSVLAVLLLASIVIMTLDARSAEESPVDRLRAAAGTVFGPLEVATASLLRPVTALPDYFGDVARLRADNARLAAENARLRVQLETTGVARRRAAALDALLGVAAGQGYELVPARVVAMGAAQAFSRTVTIDAGRRDGVVPDRTVLTGEGLVGRVVAATATTATVLLIVDKASVVGGRLDSTSELGFVRGRGDIDDDARLELQLVDDVATPQPSDTVVTWGSRDQAPYVTGVPVGTVLRVRSAPRELSRTAILDPAVDFSSLDLVGVVVDTPPRAPRDPLSASSLVDRR
ncbi:MAG: rod shape-determining protein MreC [Actinomycetota bacterium]|nr:rod shape-determining protein MreC [Actinomycetota bacterium]